jgi:phosphatidylserine/phosphatidylglycerophosphate/cardiolipin synthase-like enzyme
MGLNELADSFFIPNATPFTQTRVDPIVDGANYFAAIQRDLLTTSGPGDCIYILSWLLRPAFALDGGTGRTLKDILLTQAAAGVDVRIIVWANYHFTTSPRLAHHLAPGEASIAGGNVASVESLRTAQAVRSDGTLAQPLNRSVLIDWTGSMDGSHHQKATIIKAGAQVTAYLGGMDFAQSRLDTTAHVQIYNGVHSGFHDVGARITGSGVAGVWNNFRTRWIEIRGCQRDFVLTTSTSGSAHPYPHVHANPPLTGDVMSTAPSVPPPIAPVDSPHQRVQILASFGGIRDNEGGPQANWQTLPRNGLQQIRDAYRKALANASLFVYIEDQFILAESYQITFFELMQDITDAMDRGVRIIMVTGTDADMTDPGTAPSLELGTLLQGCVDRSSHPSNLAVWVASPLFVHSKVMIVDDSYLIMGSANFEDRSMLGNDSELDVAVIEEPGGLDAIKGLRTALWAEHMGLLAADGTMPGAIRSSLQSPDACLSVWRRSWGDPVAFSAPHTRLHMVGPATWATDR